VSNAKEKEHPMGHGAAIAPLPILMRYGKSSWCGASDYERHLLLTPQWVQRADKARSTSGLQPLNTAHPPSRR